MCVWEGEGKQTDARWFWADGEEYITSFSRKLSSADLLKAESNESQAKQREKEREIESESNC